MMFIILLSSLQHKLYINKIQDRVWDKSLTLNIKSEQNKLSDTQNTVLFAFLSNLSILKIYNKEFLKSKSFCPSLIITALQLPCSNIKLGENNNLIQCNTFYFRNFDNFKKQFFTIRNIKKERTKFALSRSYLCFNPLQWIENSISYR